MVDFAPSGGLGPSAQPGQDGQINYLSILTIFVKQRTYLATLPNPHLPANAFFQSEHQRGTQTRGLT